MAGHSKWKNIQHRKGKQDAAKGKIFTKLIRELTIASRMGGSDVDANPRLSLAVDKALSHNLPKDTMDRAIIRGAGAVDGDNVEEIRYEGYAPGGVALLINCATDNRNRTVGEVRHILTRHGGNLGTDGSVAYLFKQCGLLGFPPDSDEEKIMQLALDAGADDVVTNADTSIDVLTTPDAFPLIRSTMEQGGLVPTTAEITMIASIQVPVENEQAEKILRLLEALDDLDDVQNVYSNADIPDEVMAAILGE